MTTPVLDRDIRPLVVAHLRASGASWVRPECAFCTDARVDVAAIVGGAFVGVEIKSERDSLARLTPPAGFQVEQFGRVFDRVTLACAARHLARAEALVPAWWGLAVPVDGALSPRRPARPNPGDASARLACILWSDEAREVAKLLGVTRGARTKWELTRRLALVPADDLRPLVIERVVRRVWTRHRPARNAPPG